MPHNRMMMARKGPAVPVLMYHHVSPSDGAYTVHPELFRAQLQWLKENGYHCLTAPEYQRFQLSGELPAERAVLLAFDDGWLDNWAYAAPALAEAGLSAVLFVVSSWPGEGAPRHELRAGKPALPRHQEAMLQVADETTRDRVIMRWSELKWAMEEGVFSLESHSHTHGGWWGERSAEAMLSALKQDLQDSRQTFVEMLGREPHQFCWPRGEFSWSMRQLAEEAGFPIQHSTLRGTNFGSHGGRAVTRRINVENQPLEWFASRVTLYSRPYVGAALGALHQLLQGWRMGRKHSAVLPGKEFFMPPWRTV